MSDDDWDRSSFDFDLDQCSAVPSPNSTTETYADATTNATTTNATTAENQSDWSTTFPQGLPAQPSAPTVASTPMIIVDFTLFTSGLLHNRNDRNSNSDPTLASSTRKQIEGDYKAYSSDKERLASRCVIPCSTGVYQSALARLRDDTPGHYFVPIFPPK